MGKKAKLTHIQAKKSWTAQFPFHRQCFLLEIHQLGSGVQAGATNRRPTREREKKNHNGSLWTRKDYCQSGPQ